MLKKWLKRIGAFACGAAAVALPQVSVPAALVAAAACSALGLSAVQDYQAGKATADLARQLFPPKK